MLTAEFTVCFVNENNKGLQLGWVGSGEGGGGGGGGGQWGRVKGGKGERGGRGRCVSECLLFMCVPLRLRV